VFAANPDALASKYPGFIGDIVARVIKPSFGLSEYWANCVGVGLPVTVRVDQIISISELVGAFRVDATPGGPEGAVPPPPPPLKALIRDWGLAYKS